MKKTKDEKRRLASKAKKKAANSKKNALTKERRTLQRLSPEARKKMMLKELRELEAYEKQTRENILTKMQEKSVDSLEEQKAFLEKSLEELDEGDIKNHTTRQRIKTLIKQIDLSENLDFLREFHTELKENADLKDIFDPETGKVTAEYAEEVYNSYRTSLEKDKISFLDPEEFFKILGGYEIPNFDQVKALWCLYMESNSLLQVGYLITVIVKKVLIEDTAMIEEFIKIGSELP